MLMTCRNERAAVALVAVLGVALPIPAAAGVATEIETVRPAPHLDAKLAGRRSCPLGQHYSTYYRRCVWWLPIRTGRDAPPSAENLLSAPA